MAVGNEEPVLRRIETCYLIGSNHHFGHQLCNWVGCGVGCGVGWLQQCARGWKQTEVNLIHDRRQSRQLKLKTPPRRGTASRSHRFFE